MHANRTSTVAVTDAAGGIVTAMSASDVRGLNTENFFRVFMPIPQFLKISFGEEKKVKRGRR
jgi:hypothetical protein